MVLDVYLGNLLHVCNHLIIALCLFAQPGKKRLAMNGLASRTEDSGCLGRFEFTFHATK